MKSLFREWRKKNIDKVGKYILYAFGEILLIIIGILIAVSINEYQTSKKENILRCEYLRELDFAIEYDITDVNTNINAFGRRNPRIKKILVAIENETLHQMDSLLHHINMLNKYVFFVQQSKSKIDELKYSPINLILNRDLKHKVLLYQESKLYFLKYQEERTSKGDEAMDQYFLKNYNDLNTEDLVKDREFLTLVRQKYNFNEGMKENYMSLLEELHEIKRLIGVELSEHCS